MQEVFETVADSAQTFELELEEKLRICVAGLGDEATMDDIERPAAVVVLEADEALQSEVILDVVVPASHRAPVGGQGPIQGQVGLCQSQFTVVTVGQIDYLMVSGMVLQTDSRQIGLPGVGIPLLTIGSGPLVVHIQGDTGDQVREQVGVGCGWSGAG